MQTLLNLHRICSFATPITTVSVKSLNPPQIPARSSLMKFPSEIHIHDLSIRRSSALNLKAVGEDFKALNSRPIIVIDNYDNAYNLCQEKSKGNPYISGSCKGGPISLWGYACPFTAGRYHSLVIARDGFPDELEITPWTEDGLVMAACHRKYRHLQGVQFHPESILTPEGKGIINNFIKTLEGN